MEEYRNKQKAQRPLVFLQQKFEKETGKRLPRWVIKSLIKKYGFSRVISCLQEIDFSNSREPIAFLTVAIKNGWRNFKKPEYLKQYEIEKAEQLKKAKDYKANRSVGEYINNQNQRDNERRQALRRQLNLLQRGNI